MPLASRGNKKKRKTWMCGILPVLNKERITVVVGAKNHLERLAMHVKDRFQVIRIRRVEATTSVKVIAVRTQEGTTLSLGSRKCQIKQKEEAGVVKAAKVEKIVNS